MFVVFVPQTKYSLNVPLYEYTHFSLNLWDQHFAHHKNILNIILLDSLIVTDLQITRKFNR